MKAWKKRRAWPLSAILSCPSWYGQGRDVAITFWLGTDKYGRDILSRLLIGVRVSLAVGLVTVLLSLTVGVLLGALAGYFGGRVDEIILWLINVIWSIPTLLLVFAIMLLLGKGFWQVFIAIGLTLWVNVARIVRGRYSQCGKGNMWKPPGSSVIPMAASCSAISCQM
jgi:ABC-type dipeptide/oligopeptide/nickel transport system permease subunit